MTPSSRAEMVAQSLKVAKDNKLEAAGFLENSPLASAHDELKRTVCL
jgi:hypothetical protein